MLWKSFQVNDPIFYISINCIINSVKPLFIVSHAIRFPATLWRDFFTWDYLPLIILNYQHSKKDKIRFFSWVIRKCHWYRLTRGVLLHCGKKLGRHRGLEPRTLQQSWLSSALPDELMAVYLICPVLVSGHISFGVGAYYGEVKIQSWWNHDNFDWFIILVQPGKPVFHRIFNSDKIRENHSVSKVTVYVFLYFSPISG